MASYSKIVSLSVIKLMFVTPILSSVFLFEGAAFAARIRKTYFPTPSELQIPHDQFCKLRGWKGYETAGVDSNQPFIVCFVDDRVEGDIASPIGSIGLAPRVPPVVLAPLPQACELKSNEFPDSLLDLVSAMPAPLEKMYPVSTFEELYQKYISPGIDPCLVDRTELERNAVEILKATLLKTGGEQPKAVDLASLGLKEQIVALWRALIVSVYRYDFPEARNEEIAPIIEKTVTTVKKALDQSIIPLPVLDDVITTNDRTQVDAFTFSSLSNYFFLEVAPITVSRFSPVALNRRKEHPLSRFFFVRSYALMRHDLEHVANVIGSVTTNLKLTNLYAHREYRKCLSAALEKIDTLPRKKRADLRRALFFVHHEISTVFQFRETRAVRPGVVMDFSLERVLSSKPFSDPKFDFLVGPIDDQRKICAFINQSFIKVGDYPLKYDDNNVQRVIAEVTPFMDGFFGEDIPSIMNQKGKFTHSEGATHAYLRSGVLANLAISCFHLGFGGEGMSDTQVEPPKEAEELLKARFHSLKEAGLVNAFKDEVLSMFDHLDELTEYFSFSSPLAPGCEKFGLSIISTSFHATEIW